MNVYRYQFSDDMQFSDAEETFVLSLFVTEALHGEPASRLHIAHAADESQKRMAVECRGEVGLHFNMIFCGLLSKEFGRDAFEVKRAN